jgi:hypothetical protein
LVNLSLQGVTKTLPGLGVRYEEIVTPAASPAAFAEFLADRAAASGIAVPLPAFEFSIA